jgi:hypothetical protein
VIPIRAVGGAVGKFGWKGLAKIGGSHTWSATGKWLTRTGWRQFAGQELHHWLVPRKTWGKLIPDAIKNQPWNLLGMPDDLGVLHDAIHGTGKLEMGIAGRLWYGSPLWAKGLLGSGVGRAIDAFFDN